MNTKILACCAVIISLAACTRPQTADKAMAVRPSGTGSVAVSIQGVASDKGIVYGSIYLSTDGFPDDKGLAYTYQSAPAAEANAGSLSLDFPSIPAGWFVVAVLHDEDGDEELRMNRLGIPKEDYGFSRNPDSIFGPPAFDDAAVYLESGTMKKLVITIE